MEDTPVGEVLRRLVEYATVESPMEMLTQRLITLRILPALRGLGVLKTKEDRVRLTLRTRAGETIERTVEPEEKFNLNTPKLSPSPFAPAPLFLKEVGRYHWFERLPDADAMFVQVNQMIDSKDETLAEFGLKLRKALKQTGVKNLVIDVRHNNGGTTQFYPELLRTVIAHTVKEGNRLYVLIGRGVYSACANFVTDLEHLAKPTFVGEPTGGFGNQHGDSSIFTLPYSKVGTQLSGMWWQLSTPTDKRRSLVPDIPIELTAKDWLEGRDPALEVVLKDIKRPARPVVPDFP